MAARKPKVGRPSLGDSARTKVVHVKFSQDEYDAVAAAAKRSGATVSAAIREPALVAAGFVFCRWCESRAHRWCCKTCGNALERDDDACSKTCLAAWNKREDDRDEQQQRALNRV